ncbi:hypothetical protein CRENBAI_016016 [Crenichthys baileyi]|uniref:Secreted protein n=1 Tax=Crenichthys baileyi TaxID=28760 RepID=A0AAV9RZZ0_9TELE
MASQIVVTALYLIKSMSASVSRVRVSLGPISTQQVDPLRCLALTFARTTEHDKGIMYKNPWTYGTKLRRRCVRGFFYMQPLENNDWNKRSKDKDDERSKRIHKTRKEAEDKDIARL